MKKRMIAGLATLALGGSAFLGFTGTSGAACDSGSTRDGTSSADNPVTGGEIYYTEPGSTAGTIGTEGDTGYIEASGNAEGPSGHIQGSTSGGEVNGRIDDSLDVCVNDQP